MNNQTRPTGFLKGMMLGFAAIVAILASIATFTGYTVKDFTDTQHSHKPAPADTSTNQLNIHADSGGIEVKTSGYNSPAVIGNDVKIEYNSGTSDKGDSVSQKPHR